MITVCQDCQKRLRTVLYDLCRIRHPAGDLLHLRRAGTSAGGFRACAVAKSEDSRMDSLAGDFSDPSALAGLENDPQAMGRMMRKMGNEMGEQLPPEFNDVVDRLEKGQSPEEIEKEMPDLGAGMDDGGGGDDL